MGDRRWRTPLILLALTALLLGGVSVVGEEASDLPVAEPGVLLADDGLWCPQASGSGAGDARFALDGRVATVRQGATGGVLGLEVLAWFRGPPVSQVDVEVVGASDDRFEAGDRLLVQGSWDPEGGPPRIDRCRARTWTAATARAWEGAAGPAGAGDGPVVQVGEPVARYDAVGFRRTGEVGGPVLTGVLVRQGDCLYVADGLTRWLPVFPSGQVGWDPAAELVLLGGYRLGVGQVVRLGGSPEQGGPLPGPPVVPQEGDGQLVDPAGLPAGCDPAAPRFVVSEPAAGALATEVLSSGEPEVRAVRQAAREHALEPSAVTGRLELDEFGWQSLQFLVTATAGPLAGDVAVSIGTVPDRAWPDAFATEDASVRSTRDGPLRGLPARSGTDSELVSVERSDRTQVMLRAPGGQVVTVTVALPATDDRVVTMAGLAEAVASGGGAGQR